MYIVNHQFSFSSLYFYTAQSYEWLDIIFHERFMTGNRKKAQLRKILGGVKDLITEPEWYEIIESPTRWIDRSLCFALYFGLFYPGQSQKRSSGGILNRSRFQISFKIKCYYVCYRGMLSLSLSSFLDSSYNLLVLP